MRIAVTTPTGHIGRQVVSMLLKQGGHELVLLARKPDKLSREKAAGATVEPGDLADAKYVEQATRGVEALFWVNPPNATTNDYTGYCRSLTDNAAAAVKANKIPRVVFISSEGGHLGKGVGVVNPFRDMERTLRETGASLTVLRPAFFMENLLLMSDGIRKAGTIYWPIRPDAKTSMIATKDVAEVAAQELTHLSGKEMIELGGPSEYAFKEVATAIGRGLRKHVGYVKVTPQQAHDALTDMGMSSHMADLMVELQTAIDTGRMGYELPPDERMTTPTTLEQFAQTVLVPALGKSGK